MERCGRTNLHFRVLEVSGRASRILEAKREGPSYHGTSVLQFPLPPHILIQYIGFRRSPLHHAYSLNLRLTHAPKSTVKNQESGPAASGLTILG